MLWCSKWTYLHKKVARILHAHNGECLCRHLREQEGKVAKRVDFSFTRARAQGALA